MLLLPAVCLVLIATPALLFNVVIVHETDPDPARHKYVWNPFLAFCGPNATRVLCAGVCPETCDFKSLQCTTHCGVHCKCKEGYVYHEPKLKCMLRSECPSNAFQREVQAHRVFQ
ncbi:CG34189 [Drosophila busckii]|uniref:CG34189 n=1 Tax=Drosophila busckii TaxID=30019 RepID=A0A0M5J2Y9_DROBS|nr:accessory gland protein Acp62F [Drosophila busckii]ALC42086.1 CG34189 [Drosophila busckii]